MWVVKHWNKLTACYLPTTPANIQGQVGLGCQVENIDLVANTDLVEDVPAYC